MKKFFNEFKSFAMHGSVIDLAVGVIIGAAFQAIVASLVDDIISPLLGLIARKDFSDFSFAIGNAEIRYGAFITAVINFIIMACVIFMLVKILSTILRRNKEEAPSSKRCPYCCTDIHIDASRCPHCTSQLKNE